MTMVGVMPEEKVINYSVEAEKAEESKITEKHVETPKKVRVIEQLDLFGGNLMEQWRRCGNGADAEFTVRKENGTYDVMLKSRIVWSSIPTREYADYIALKLNMVVAENIARVREVIENTENTLNDAIKGLTRE